MIIITFLRDLVTGSIRMIFNIEPVLSLVLLAFTFKNENRVEKETLRRENRLILAAVN